MTDQDTDRIEHRRCRTNSECAFEASRDELTGCLRRIERQISDMRADLKVGGVRFEALESLPKQVSENAREIALQRAESSRISKIVYGLCGVALFAVIGSLVASVLK